MAQKLTPHFSTRKLTAPQLKAFRSAVAQLKKRGLIDKSIDARKAQPYQVKGGKSLVEQVNKHAAEFTPAPNTPLRPTNLAKLNKGMSFRDFPIQGRNLAEAFRNIEENPDLADAFDTLKKPDEKWAFTVNGRRSKQVFPDIRLLIEEAFHYQGEREHLDVFHKHSRSRELFDKLQIVRWNDDQDTWRTGAAIIIERQRKQQIAKNKRKKADAKRKAAKRRKKK